MNGCIHGLQLLSQVQFLEIHYKGNNDLLVDFPGAYVPDERKKPAKAGAAGAGPSVQQSKGGAAVAAKECGKVEIRSLDKHTTVVDNLSEVDLQTPEQAINLVTHAAKKR